MTTTRNERIAKLQRDLASLRSRGQRIWAESDMLVRDVRIIEAELAALKADLANDSEVLAQASLAVPAGKGGAP